ncbi:thiamine pyrophosphate-dependent enzyme [Fontivita pretiosa]|uniref:thiamine pyrophosphate-dependent enzyme n=1 Tax=Fontivita pretiosa TaxID=2989684 RepID=UPI003D181FA3
MPITPAVLPRSVEQVVDARNFFERVIPLYERGVGDIELEADLDSARSAIPAGTGAPRDFSFIAPEIPEFISSNCVGCMDCVTECPDTAILGKVIPRSQLEAALAKMSPQQRARVENDWAKTRKYWQTYEKQGKEPGYFGIFIDPTKCKGCAECVQVCDDHALKMIKKTDTNMPVIREKFDHFRAMGPTLEQYINDKVLADMMLKDTALQYVGGAGSCAGCGEATVLRMFIAATCFKYGPENVGLIAATGCNTVYTSTYPYNPYRLPWSNSLFENAPTFAMGVRAKWNQQGWENKRLWVIGGDGAMMDIGFQALSRMLMSGMDIKVIVLDTQVYSNTGGQASTSTFMGQNTKMSVHGKEIAGKTERRKELAQIVMAHPDVFVAQTTAAHVNHFYKAILRANEYKGPAVIITYTTCQPEHGVGDHLAGERARLAVDSRTFPLIIYDPEAGERIRDRLSLKGNPAMDKDWYTDPKTGQPVDFITFARGEGRFEKHFDRQGNPSAALLLANEDRRRNWRMLQEMAGIEPETPQAAATAQANKSQ